MRTMAESRWGGAMAGRSREVTQVEAVGSSRAPKGLLRECYCDGRLHGVTREDDCKVIIDRGLCKVSGEGVR